MKIYPVILSGGAGTRLWPLSRAALPKQLLPVVADKTMLQDTALRLNGRPELMQPLIVCGNDHRFLVAEQLREINVKPLGILLESEGRNTAPAVAAAAHFLKAIDAEAVMLVLPADHVISDTEAVYMAHWPRSVSCPRHRRRDTVTSAAANRCRWRTTASRSIASSRSPTAPRRKNSSRQAIISGTAACSCSAPMAT